jgi:L-alanine-DL-glutamate epimerase-like enolase superfamily enzyme
MDYMDHLKNNFTPFVAPHLESPVFTRAMAQVAMARNAITIFKEIIRDLPEEKQHTDRNIQVLDALEDYVELLSSGKCP